MQQGKILTLLHPLLLYAAENFCASGEDGEGSGGEEDEEQLRSLGLFRPEEKRLRGGRPHSSLPHSSFLRSGAERQVLISAL